MRGQRPRPNAPPQTRASQATGPFHRRRPEPAFPARQGAKVGVRVPPTRGVGWDRDRRSPPTNRTPPTQKRGEREVLEVAQRGSGRNQKQILRFPESDGLHRSPEIGPRSAALRSE